MVAGVEEQTHRRGEFVPAGFARPDVAHAGLAHEFGSCRGEHEIVAIGAVRKSDTARHNGSAVRLGLSDHGILLRLLSPSVLSSRDWHVALATWREYGA